MHPLNNGSQVADKPAPKPRIGSPGWFTESGDKGAPSYPGQDWFNAVIAEFQNALTAQGVHFNPDNFDHLAKLFNRGHDALIGKPLVSFSRTPAQGTLRANGAEIARADYPKLWQWAHDNQLVLAQATKDSDPFGKSAYYGTGNGSTTFTVPHFHQGQVFRGASSLGQFLETQGDAQRNITGEFSSRGMPNTDYGVLVGATGVFKYEKSVAAWDSVAQSVEGYYINKVTFDASRSVPTAQENRMKVTNAYIDIYTGEF
ncbi:hypothetical protein [Photobacterium damselae]|uniref:hypothetical protein n=1 Tax=Photobacterium damselae TaxID=38293 RepID=UPI000D66617F|nr:hypothetical protein [Photobacterium damselae]AWK84461.1 hypothetical protein BST98_20725 [Photobacterium damselae]